MTDLMHPALAAQRGLDLLNTAANARAVRAATPRPAPAAPTPETSVGIRIARAADAPALARLAELDDNHEQAGRLARLAGEPWEGTILVAEDDGELAAALVVEDGTVVADPFRHSAVLVALLRLRAAQLSRQAAGGLLPRALMALRPRLH